MIKRIRQLNESLPELLFGILISGILFEVIIIWFVKEKMQFSLGLLVGMFLAGFMAWHMAFALSKAMKHSEEVATTQAQKYHVIRYLIVISIVIGVVLSKAVNPLAVFLGIMTLKVSAYLEPFTNKLFRR